MSPDLDRLARSLNIVLSDQGLLEQALTHRSASRRHSYERLEFLGDACLSMVISEFLYERFPDASEGDLTRMRAMLVKGQTLARLGQQLGLGEYLRLGPGEMKSGGHRRDSILADAVEAILGAVYLDGGLEPARAFVLRHWADNLEAISPAQASKDAKTRLQEQLQSRQAPLPAYEVAEISGQAPNEVFTVVCELADGTVFSASGSSRRKAEQKAAQQALTWLEDQ